MKKAQYLYVLLALLICTACSQSTSATTESKINTSHIILPTLKPQGTLRIGPLALITGVLELDGSCIRVRTINNTSMLIIWDSDFKLEGNTIVNTRSMQQISFGEKVTLGGGTMPEGWQLVTELDLPLDKNCHGPYWRATSIND